MAETVGLVFSLISITSELANALIFTRSRNSLLAQEWSELPLLIGLLDEAARFLKTVSPENVTSAMVQAVSRCQYTAQALTTKVMNSDNNTPRQGFMLKTNAIKHMNEFKNQITTLRDLVHELMLQELLKGQNHIQNELARLDGYLRCEHGRNERDSSWKAQQSIDTSSTSYNDAATIVRSILDNESKARIHISVDPSILDGIIVTTHGDKPKWVAIRGKYDTGSDANFVRAVLIEREGMQHLLERLETPLEHVFEGLNNQEYMPQSRISLQWYDRSMSKVRQSEFYIIDDAPYDIIIGNPFIIEEAVFTIQQPALALRHKHRASAAVDPERVKREQAAAAAEQQQRRELAARERALKRETARRMMAQTSASSMLPGSDTANSNVLSPSSTLSAGDATSGPVTMTRSLNSAASASNASHSGTETPASGTEDRDQASST